MDSMNVTVKFVEVRSFTRSFIAIAVLGWGREPSILGKRRPGIGVGNDTVRKSVGEFLRWALSI